MDMNLINMSQFTARNARADSAKNALMRSGVKVESIESIRAKAEEFEAIFISQMLTPMFEGIKTDGPFGGGHGESVFRSFQIDEMGKAISKSGGIGLADAMMRQLITQTQEA